MLTDPAEVSTDLVVAMKIRQPHPTTPERQRKTALGIVLCLFVKLLLRISWCRQRHLRADWSLVPNELRLQDKSLRTGMCNNPLSDTDLA